MDEEQRQRWKDFYRRNEIVDIWEETEVPAAFDKPLSYCFSVSELRSLHLPKVASVSFLKCSLMHLESRHLLITGKFGISISRITVLLVHQTILWKHISESFSEV